GIAPEFLPHVFDRFSQADPSSSRMMGGLGLGLSLGRHLTEAHGSAGNAHSEGPGGGGTLSGANPGLAHAPPQRLPPARGQAAGPVPAAGERTATPAQRLDGIRVLIVDDEPDALELFATVLRQYGARVVAAGSAREAVAAFESESPQVLVSDIAMPEEDGYSL